MDEGVSKMYFKYNVVNNFKRCNHIKVHSQRVEWSKSGRCRKVHPKRDERVSKMFFIHKGLKFKKKCNYIKVHPQRVKCCKSGKYDKVHPKKGCTGKLNVLHT